MNHIVGLISEQRLAGAPSLEVSSFAEEVTDRNRSCGISDVRSVTNDRGLARTSDIFNNTRTSSDTRNYKVVQPGMFVYNPSRVNVGSIAWHDGATPVIVSPMYVVFSVDQSRILPSYLMLFLASSRGKNQIESKTEVGARFRLTFASMSRILLPVPSLDVQRAIVEVLDTFSKLEAELEAELEARKQQYEHYHHQLVSKNRFESLSWKPLSEIATIRTGSKPDLIAEDGSFPYVNAGTEPSGFTIDSNACGDAVTIPSRGQGGAGHIGYQASDFWCGPLCYRVASKSSDFANRFIYYYLKNIQDEIIALRKIGSIPAVNKSDLGTVLIPCVSPNEQRRIVEILDKFDALVNDLSVGLPAELVARRQQYEYYRDKLLSFREIG